MAKTFSPRCTECTGKPVLKRFSTVIDENKTYITLPRYNCDVCKYIMDSKQSIAIEKRILRLLAEYGAKFDVRE